MKLEQLKSLCDAATPGPVRWTQTEPMTIDEQCEYMAKHLRHGVDGPMNGIGCPSHPKTVLGENPDRPVHMVEMATCGNGPNGANNARMMVASVNALPSLIKLWEAAKELSETIDDDGIGAYLTGRSEVRLYELRQALSELEAL